MRINMNIEKLGVVFENFKRDNNRAILVDGPWGCGKTYQILQFLKNDSSRKSRKKNKIVYVSLFGKTTIDEIHTDIYSKLHPLKNGAKKALRLIPKVAPLLGRVGNMISNMEFALNTDEAKINSIGKNIEKASQKIENIANDINAVNDSRSKVKIIKNRTIVIFDDLERIDHNEISFTDILGYVNDLFLQNIKVIVVCNSKEIQDKKFVSFKEKVFDREYKITATKDEIINSYFGDDSKFLKEYIIKEFDNNLRIALRVSNFYREVIKQLTIYNEKYYEKISNETIMYYCAVVIVGCNSQRYLETQANSDVKNHLLFISFDDENINTIALSIYYHLKNDDTSNRIFEKLILGLLECYYYNTYDMLASIFAETLKCEDPFIEEPFCLSDDEKRELFTKQFEKIKGDCEINNRSISNILNRMCQYESLSCINNREDEIINNLIEKCVETEIHFLLDYPFEGCQRFADFRKKFTVAYEQNEIKKMINNLNDLYANKNYAKLYDWLGELARRAVFSKNNTLDKEILAVIKANNFFIEDLFATIAPSQWEVAHKICELALRYGFYEDIIAYIKSIDYKNDKSAMERYDYLIEKKLNCEK